MRRGAAAWNDFWFRPQPTSTLALVRIAYGAVMTAWTLTLLPALPEFFAGDGILPEAPAYDLPEQAGLWSVLGWWPSDGMLVGAWAALLVASVCLTLGLFSRLAALVVFVLVLSFERRNPYVFNAGDALLRIIGLYLVLAPCGAALSLDRLRRRRDRFWEFPARAPVALRLMQLQVSVIYVSTVWAKVQGDTWNDGTAVGYSLNLDDLARFPVPDLVLESAMLANLVTWAVLAVELGIGVLVWVSRLRPWVLTVGVGLHLAIDLGLRVGFFSYAVLILYLAFVPPERAAVLVLRARDLIGRRRTWTNVRLPGRRQRQSVAPTGSGELP